MKLSVYLALKDQKDEVFAAKIGCDRTTVLRLRLDRQRPSHALMEKIIAATEGAVMPNDFFDTPIVPADATNQADAA